MGGLEVAGRLKKSSMSHTDLDIVAMKCHIGSKVE